MDVEVKDGLSAVGIRIDDHAITVGGKALLAGDLGGGEQEVAEGFAMLLGRHVQRIDMSTRDDKYMGRRLRALIVERNAHVVLKFLAGRHAAVGDLAEYAVVHTHMNEFIRA